jgi:hypothetical protein
VVGVFQAGNCPSAEKTCRAQEGQEKETRNPPAAQKEKETTKATPIGFQRHNSTAFPAWEVLRMATIEGSQANLHVFVQAGDEVGSLESGKQMGAVEQELDLSERTWQWKDFSRIHARRIVV